MPLISVIVPVYKVEAYLHRCVDSVLAQTFADFELILVDDGSPDGCPAMCDEYAGRDSRVHVIHKKNGGLSDARNVGVDWIFANSDSEWVTFIDSDDWVHPEYLERLYNAAVENGVNIAVCGFERTKGEKPKVSENQLTARVQSPEDFYIEDRVTAIIACAKLYRKSLFQTIRYPVGKIHEDEFVTYRVLFAEEKVAVINAPLYAYFQNEAGIMASENAQGRYDFMEAMDEQTVYYRRSRFDKAYKYHAHTYMKKLISMFYEEKESTENTWVLKHIKKRIRRMLRTRQFSVKDHPIEYKLAFPRLIEMYWFGCAFVGKFKK